MDVGFTQLCMIVALLALVEVWPSLKAYADAPNWR